MRELDELFAALSISPFRRKFQLGAPERQYLTTKGMRTILDHAHDFIIARLVPAFPPNDGKQTPMRGHPVFIAQHATATCCRSCLERWHHIERGRELTDEEQGYIVAVISRWLDAHKIVASSL